MSRNRRTVASTRDENRQKPGGKDPKYAEDGFWVVCQKKSSSQNVCFETSVRYTRGTTQIAAFLPPLLGPTSPYAFTQQSRRGSTCSFCVLPPGSEATAPDPSFAARTNRRFSARLCPGTLFVIAILSCTFMIARFASSCQWQFHGLLREMPCIYSLFR